MLNTTHLSSSYWHLDNSWQFDVHKIINVRCRTHHHTCEAPKVTAGDYPLKEPVMEGLREILCLSVREPPGYLSLRRSIHTLTHTTAIATTSNSTRVSSTHVATENAYDTSDVEST